jgi:hypothetical protein
MNLAPPCDEGVKPQCYFNSQQVPIKNMKMEEETTEMDEETKMNENPQYVWIYVNEIYKYLRDIEVKNYFKFSVFFGVI